jgi:hypothetical protein
MELGAFTLISDPAIVDADATVPLTGVDWSRLLANWTVSPGAAAKIAARRLSAPLSFVLTTVKMVSSRRSSTSSKTSRRS